MATNRKRRPRPGGGTSGDKGGFPDWEHNSFTVEGEIERLGSIGRNLSTAPRWTRTVAKVVAVIFLLPFAYALFVFVFRLFAN